MSLLCPQWWANVNTFLNILCISNVIDRYRCRYRYFEKTMGYFSLYVQTLVQYLSISTHFKYNYFQNLFLGFPEWNYSHTESNSLRMLMFCKKTERWGDGNCLLSRHTRSFLQGRTQWVSQLHSNLSNNLKTYTIYRLPIYHLIDFSLFLMHGVLSHQKNVLYSDIISLSS